MTGKQDRAKAEASKAEEWLKAEREINKRVAAIASDLSDELRDKIATMALDKWATDRRAKPAVYADRALKDVTRVSKTDGIRRHQRVIANSETADATAEKRSAGGEDATLDLIDATRAKPIPTATIRLLNAKGEPLTTNDLKEIKPEDLTDRALQYALGALANNWELAANKNPERDSLRDMAYLLRAAAERKFRESTKFTEISSMARSWLKTNDRGPASRTQEIGALLARVASGGTPDELAERVVRGLLSYPQLAADTCIWRCHAWDGAPTQEAVSVVKDVAERTFGEPPERRTIEIMKALGCPKDKADGLFAARNMKASRARSKANPGS